MYVFFSTYAIEQELNKVLKTGPRASIYRQRVPMEIPKWPFDVELIISRLNLFTYVHNNLESREFPSDVDVVVICFLKTTSQKGSELESSDKTKLKRSPQ